YFERVDFRQLPVDETEVRGGSLVALPSLALPYDLPAGLRSMLMPFETFTYLPATPLRLLDRQSHAGFYSTGWGLLPFSLSGRFQERVELSQVSFLVEGLPEAKIETSASVAPWPGFFELDGRSPLGLVMHNDTRVSYPLAPERSVRLELDC